MMHQQQSLTQDVNSCLFETISHVSSNQEHNDLAQILTHEFAQGLPSDMEFNAY
jgi:hypothetical protein